MIIIDNFLSEQDWVQFNNPLNWQVRHENTWFDIDKEPEYFYEGLSKMIWNFFDPSHDHYANGYEYWTNILSEDTQMGWHQDKDEALYEKTKEIKTPLMGCTLYADHTDLKGGYLEIQGEELERIAPVPNRLVIFNAFDFHKVSNITSGTRRVFACNIWDKKLVGL